MSIHHSHLHAVPLHLTAEGSPSSSPAEAHIVGAGWKVLSAELPSVDIIPGLLSETVMHVLITSHLDYSKSLCSGTWRKALLLPSSW